MTLICNHHISKGKFGLRNPFNTTHNKKINKIFKVNTLYRNKILKILEHA